MYDHDQRSFDVMDLATRKLMRVAHSVNLNNAKKELSILLRNPKPSNRVRREMLHDEIVILEAFLRRNPE